MAEKNGEKKPFKTKKELRAEQRKKEREEKLKLEAQEREKKKTQAQYHVLNGSKESGSSIAIVTRTDQLLVGVVDMHDQYSVLLKDAEVPVQGDNVKVKECLVFKHAVDFMFKHSDIVELPKRKKNK